MKEMYPVRLLDAEGREVQTRLEHEVSECAVVESLTWVRVFEALDEAQDYVLELGPWGETTMAFAFEKLGFERDLYRDVDHDGFGQIADPAARSWCVPPIGFADRLGDCDDEREDTYPYAPETCDGRNNDCDGRADAAEVGLCEDAPHGSICLAELGRCGCATAEDCPSGRTCADQKCVLPLNVAEGGAPSEGPAAGGKAPATGDSEDESRAAGCQYAPASSSPFAVLAYGGMLMVFLRRRRS